MFIKALTSCKNFVNHLKMLCYKTSEFALSVPVTLIHIVGLLITFLLILTFGYLVSCTLINQLFSKLANNIKHLN